MSHTALIRFAPCTSLERINSSNWSRPGRTLYDAGSLKFLPGLNSVPLLIDHDPDREIGRVSKVMTLDDDGPWLVAVASLADPPEWLRRGTAASFGYKAASTNHDFFGCDVVHQALLTEVSVLRTSTPAEPLARVVVVREAEAKPSRSVAAVGSAAAAGDRVFYGKPGDVIRRPCGGQVLAVR